MTTTISARAVADATVRLRAAGCVFAEDEAAVLSASAVGEDALSVLVGRRAAGEPLEQVVGYADFCGVRVFLRPGVFVPRMRSGLLVHIAAEAARHIAAEAAGQGAAEAASQDAEETGGQNDAEAENRSGPETRGRDAGTARAPVVVDLCCGSGALGAAVARRVPTVVLHATDLDPVAVACARDNLTGVGTVHQGDLYAALPAELRGRVDVLIANVPYVPTGHLPFLPAEARLHEAPMALDGGGDGLEVFRAVVAEAAQWLAPGGVLLSEVTAAQSEAAQRIVRAGGLRAGACHDDDAESTAVTARRG